LGNSIREGYHSMREPGKIGDEDVFLEDMGRVNEEI
jgi:hypothetical protein